MTLKRKGRIPISPMGNMTDGLETMVQLDDDDSSEYDKLYAAIKHLNEIDRAIILLYLEEHSYQEISEIMGITVSNVGVKINRIKNRLKRILK